MSDGDRMLEIKRLKVELAGLYATTDEAAEAAVNAGLKPSNV